MFDLLCLLCLFAGCGGALSAGTTDLFYTAEETSHIRPSTLPLHGKQHSIRGQGPLSVPGRNHRGSRHSQAELGCHLQGLASPLAWTFEANSVLGELQSVDGYMNIALEKTQEYVNGKLRHSYGDAFIRGNNGSFFSYCARSLLTLYPVPSALHFCLMRELAT